MQVTLDSDGALRARCAVSVPGPLHALGQLLSTTQIRSLDPRARSVRAGTGAAKGRIPAVDPCETAAQRRPSCKRWPIHRPAPKHRQERGLAKRREEAEPPGQRGESCAPPFLRRERTHPAFPGFPRTDRQDSPRADSCAKPPPRSSQWNVHASAKQRFLLGASRSNHITEGSSCS